MPQGNKKYVDIVFPQNINRLTYSLPEHLAYACLPGMLVEAPLRGKRTKGIVVEILPDRPLIKGLKQIKSVIDIARDFTFPQTLLSLLDWVASYYMCSEGLALKSLLFLDALRQPVRRRARRKVIAENPTPSLPGIEKLTLPVMAALNARSFKTFLYHSGGIAREIALIMNIILQVRNVIIVVPEQYDISYFRPFLEQEAVGRYCVLHGKMGKNELADSYKGILSGKYDIVIGTMQTVFAPLRDTSILIVFKEHSEFYKHEETPTYSVRDVAVKRASIENIPVLLTSLSPSFESYFNCRKGKYTLIDDSAELKEPHIRIINAQGSDGLITHPLRNAIHQTLHSGEKALIILNRKGHSILKCRDCGHMEVCPRCDVPYVYHAEKILKCHYCGKTEKVPGLCPVCKSPHFRFATTGTEKAFDVLKKEFNTSVTLIDSEHADGGKRGGNLGNIIIGTDLALRKIKPFSRFGLTAILNADIHLQRPDFRVYERFFQHAAYVSEFTDEDGGMFIQTFDWKNPFFMHIMNRDYETFFSGEMQKRIDFHYPPVYRMALLTLKKTDLKTHMPPSGKGEYEILGPVPGTSRDSKVEFLLKCRSDRPIQEYVRSAVGMIARRDNSLKIDIDPLVFL